MEYLAGPGGGAHVLASRSLVRTSSLTCLSPPAIQFPISSGNVLQIEQ